MKIRCDFVTNSSSSSFIISRKDGLSEEQKQAMISFIEKYFLGELKLSPESSDEEIMKYAKDHYDDEDDEDNELLKRIRNELKEGRSIYEGYIEFEEAEFYYSKLFSSLWDALEKVDDTSFQQIDTDLSY